MKLKTIVALISFCWFSFECTAQNNTDRAEVRKDGKDYSIKVQNITLEVEPSAGGRIAALTLDGKNFLTDRNVNHFNWGSTFWPSPQSEWNWPPSAEIDNMPYTAKVENNELVMVSQKDSATGFVVIKKFSGNKKKSSYTLKYTIINESDKSQKVAPWEITRVHTKGFAFFPMGEGERRGGLTPLTIQKNGIIWFNYQKDKLPVKGDRQLYSDGSEGWLAEVNNGIILIQQSPDISIEKVAPKEGEEELYASPVKPGKSYVEIEHQGAYQQLQPGASLTWKVNWFLKKLPDNINPEVGNAVLVSYVQQLLQSD